MSVGKLPEGWVGSKLGDVVDVNSGIGFPGDAANLLI